MTGPEVININNGVNAELTQVIEHGKLVKEYKMPGNTTKAEVEDLVKMSIEDKNNVAEKCKDDIKKTKVLEKYQEVLKKIQELLSIIPDNTDNLSLKEMMDKIDHLSKTRNNIANQINFTYYQETMNRALKEIVDIEEAFQKGEMKASDCLNKMKAIQGKTSFSSFDVPDALVPMNESLKGLVGQYIKAYSSPDVISISNGDVEISRPSISFENKHMFEQLNNYTKELTGNINMLLDEMNAHEPYVSLDKLMQSAKDANEYISTEDWNEDELSVKIVNLKAITNDLYNTQVEKNNQTESYHEKIEIITKTANDLSYTNKRETANNIIEESNERTKTSIETVEKVDDLLQGVDPDIVADFTACIEEQFEGDQEAIDEFFKDPEVADIANSYDTDNRAGALDAVEQLKEDMQKIQLENGSVLHYDNNEDESEEK